MNTKISYTTIQTRKIIIKIQIKKRKSQPFLR